MRKQAGFTLIEVLIALVIAAISLAALSRTMGMTTHNQALLEEKVVATWVAQNALLQQQISGQQNSDRQQIEMLGREWQVSQKIEPTQLPEFKKLSIEVRQIVNREVQDKTSSRLVSVVGADGI
ncbi:type II secretion system minor pseudopilin GspI [Thiomicrorhabdus sp. 6S2-11]|uniref:Type II secretion system protein I n=1 Tax=Thiomicrorhabdus marina TaxID=2818442 RepID=A0ABS3Q6P3_9GAMM|nr:type II secretion system minor pseudopilin GspI [Thiomicrorhabdus marina]MBO1928005.1 type II secretion system minor pseudopilin GspI [Thiomicrorhabdus marina]